MFKVQGDTHFHELWVDCLSVRGIVVSNVLFFSSAWLTLSGLEGKTAGNKMQSEIPKIRCGVQNIYYKVAMAQSLICCSFVVKMEWI